jgi:hypothetical protein
MPISIDEFEAVAPEDERSTAELIVRFLIENSEQAFTRSEIAEAVDRAPTTVGTNLSRLKDRGLVRHRKQYWAITDDRDRLAQALHVSDALSGLTADFGPLITSEEDAEAWSEAQPDQPHPSDPSSAAATEDSDSADAEN